MSKNLAFQSLKIEDNFFGESQKDHAISLVLFGGLQQSRLNFFYSAVCKLYSCDVVFSQKRPGVGFDACGGV
jgi:hypothetical protein